jgi:hypothetical protein
VGVGVGVGAYRRDANGRCQDLPDKTDRKREDTLVGVYNDLLNQLKLPQE